MHSFITTWLAHHKPYKRHPERTLKSFAFQEAESISREAKVTWCQCNGQAVISLQHDGIVVALAEGSDPSTVALQLQTASEEALGYEMPCTVVHCEAARIAHGYNPTSSEDQGRCGNSQHHYRSDAVTDAAITKS